MKYIDIWFAYITILETSVNFSKQSLIFSHFHFYDYFILSVLLRLDRIQSSVWVIVIVKRIKIHFSSLSSRAISPIKGGIYIYFLALALCAVHLLFFASCSSSWLFIYAFIEANVRAICINNMSYRHISRLDAFLARATVARGKRIYIAQKCQCERKREEKKILFFGCNKCRRWEGEAEGFFWYERSVQTRRGGVAAILMKSPALDSLTYLDFLQIHSRINI